MQIKRHIARLLFLCFAVYLGHNLIPHHHHSEVPASMDACACPCDHQNHGEGHSSCTPCHAFNDIDFVKYSHAGIPDPVHVYTDLLISDSASNPDPLKEAGLSQLYFLKLPILSALCSGPPSLRAPPPVA